MIKKVVFFTFSILFFLATFDIQASAKNSSSNGNKKAVSTKKTTTNQVSKKVSSTAKKLNASKKNNASNTQRNINKNTAKNVNKISYKDAFEAVSDKGVIAVIDKIESGKSILQKKSTEDDYYVGMVGDKRTGKGLNLALTMEERGAGNWLLILNGKEIEKNSLVQTSLLSNPSRFVVNVNIKALKDKVVSFTYQMPRDLRLRYGNQENGYRIVIDLPVGTKIETKNMKKDQLSFKLINKSLAEAYNTTINSPSNSFENFDGLKTLGNGVSFRKILIEHKKPYVIAVDAGHGGIDSGAVGVDKASEKKITLMYAKSLKQALQKRGFQVVLTRDSDKTISLINRVQIAQSNNADVFISLHTDAHNDKNVSGTTVYRLSHLEGHHPDWGKFYYKGVLPERYESYKRDRSVLDVLVGLTHQSLSEKSSILVDNILLSFKKNGVCKNCRHGQRSLAVLRGLKMISVLVEIGYITNKEEVKKMMLESNVEKFANKLADVVNDTFN